MYTVKKLSFSLIIKSQLKFFSWSEPEFPILQKATKIQMKYILTHQKTKLSQVLQEDSRHGIPNTYSIQMIFDGRHPPEPVDKMKCHSHFILSTVQLFLGVPTTDGTRTHWKTVFSWILLTSFNSHLAYIINLKSFTFSQKRGSSSTKFHKNSDSEWQFYLQELTKYLDVKGENLSVASRDNEGKKDFF